MRVLGIDPGLRLTGYACVSGWAGGSAWSGGSAAGGEGWTGGSAAGSDGRTRASANSAQPVGHGFDGVEVVEAGVFRLTPTATIAARLVELEQDFQDALERLRPDIVAVEKLYSHYRHPTTAAIMGHARGVVLLAACRAGVQLVELGATEVKKSLTGNGHAKKSQMQDAVMLRLGLSSRPEPADVADAIAIACCCLVRSDVVAK